MTTNNIQSIVEAQRAFFRTGETLDVKWRINQLKRLRAAVRDHSQEMEQALADDLGRSAVEAYLCDVLPIITEIDETIRGLRRWARPECHYSGLMCFPSIVTKVYKMPYGVTLIISPFNFPMLLTLGVLAASIAGGNTAVIKASSKSSASTAMLKRFIADLFPPEYVTLIDGGHDVADECLAQRFDKIFYTGSPAVGKHVMAEAAARKIAFFKSCNAGQICININQVAVAEEVVEPFLDELKAAFAKQLGDRPEQNDEYPHLISEAAYDKCVALAEEYRERIVFGGRGVKETKRYAPTIIYPVSPEEHIVQHELFNPLLPIVPYRDAEVEQLMATIAEREHPLSMYLFTRNLRWARRTMQRQQYGGGCVNEVCIHLMVKGVPFNGTGHSGMGAYHGIWGFREFTHPSTVLWGCRHFNLPLREHPYTGRKNRWKMWMLKKIGG